MSNTFVEELRNVWGCLNDKQSLCGALALADFSQDSAKTTAPKPLQDKALSRGGGAKRKPRKAFRSFYNTFDTS